MLRIPYAITAWTALAVLTPASASTCPLVTDGVGDDRSRGVTALGSPLLDVVSADLASGATSVVAVVRVADLGVRDPDTTALGAEWALLFKIGSTYNNFQAQLHRSGAWHGYFNGLSVPLGVDLSTHELSWQVPRSMVPALATPGATFSNIAVSSASFVNGDHASTTQTYVDQDPGCIPAP